MQSVHVSLDHEIYYLLNKSIPMKEKLNHLTLLKEHGLNFNQRLSSGHDTILHGLMWAAEGWVENEAEANEFLALIDFLLRNGADPKLTDNKHQTALHSFACVTLPSLFEENTATIYKFITQLTDVLVKHGLDINAEDEFGMAAISYAVKDDNYNLVRAFIEKGADLDLTNGDGLSLLHLSIVYSSPELAQLLIDAGINLKIKNRQGETPLVFATAARERLYQANCLTELQVKQLAVCDKVIEVIETQYKAMRELLRQRQALTPSVPENSRLQNVDDALKNINSLGK